MIDESNEPENALKVNEHSKIKKKYGFCVGLWKYRRKKLGLVLFKTTTTTNKPFNNYLVNYLAGRLM